MLFMVHPHMVPAKNVPGGHAVSNSGQVTGSTGTTGAIGTTSASAGGQTGGAGAALKAERYRPR